MIRFVTRYQSRPSLGLFKPLFGSSRFQQLAFTRSTPSFHRCLATEAADKPQEKPPNPQETKAEKEEGAKTTKTTIPPPEIVPIPIISIPIPPPPLEIEIPLTLPKKEVRIPPPVLWFGAFSAAPIVVSALGVMVLPPIPATVALFSQVALGAPLLAFSGAIHWGLAATHYRRPGFPPVDTKALTAWQYSLGSLSVVLGWGALLLPPMWALPWLGAGFSIMSLSDILAWTRGAAPPWFLQFRQPYSTILVVSFIFTWLVVILRGHIEGPPVPIPYKIEREGGRK